MYASGLFNVMGPRLSEAVAFADNSQLYVSFQPNENANETAAITAMQNCIDDVRKWMLINKLKLNDGKTEFLLIGTRQQIGQSEFKYYAYWWGLCHLLKCTKSLGCWFDPQFKFETHITNVCNAAFFHK